MGPGWVPAGGKRHPFLPAWREADAGEAKGPLPVAASLPSPAQLLSFIPGLALFSCVGADANVTEGLPCEGCAGEEVWERKREAAVLCLARRPAAAYQHGGPEPAMAKVASLQQATLGAAAASLPAPRR